MVIVIKTLSKTCMKRWDCDFLQNSFENVGGAKTGTRSQIRLACLKLNPFFASHPKQTWIKVAPISKATS